MGPDSVSYCRQKQGTDIRFLISGMDRGRQRVCTLGSYPLPLSSIRASFGPKLAKKVRMARCRADFQILRFLQFVE